MKPIIERPCDQTMRFFTPELYRQFNSSDDEVADRADAAWEKALADYDKHFTGIKDRLPSLVKSLAELRLHDAEVVAPIEEIASGGSGPAAEVPPTQQAPTWSAMAVMTLKHQGEFLTLIYSLWDRIRQDSPPPDWPFSQHPVYWLYDELDLSPDSNWPIIHRVLFSDGSVIEIPFQSVAIHKFNFSDATQTANAAN